MAYTTIHSITKTPRLAMNYIQKNKVNENGEMCLTVSSYQHCSSGETIKYFESLRQKAENGRRRDVRTKNGKTNIMWHCIQTFEESPQEMSVELAQLIGRKLASEMFGEFACVISTHTDTERIHNHIVFGAWGLDGKKYNDCLKTKRQIRKISDKLCKEHGLSIIEHAKDMKVVKWKDEAGKTRIYEPTARKEMIREGEFSNTNDYRNTQKYADGLSSEMSNRERVRLDIEDVLPDVSSYEELIEKLRERGYVIKDKKKNGDWRTHVTFKAPSQDKGVRDYKIADDDYYARENLTKIIEGIVAERKKGERAVGRRGQTIIEEAYEYGKTDIDDLNEEYKIIKFADGETKREPRTEIERDVIKELKINFGEIESRFDIGTPVNIPSVKTNRCKFKNFGMSEKRKKYLEGCIKEDFKALRFIEKEKISSRGQLVDIAKSLMEEQARIKLSLKETEIKLSKIRQRFSVIEKLEIVKARVKTKESNPEYVMTEMDSDKILINEYNELMRKYGLDSQETVEKVRVLIGAYERRYIDLKKELEGNVYNLNECNGYINTLDRVYRDVMSGRGGVEINRNQIGNGRDDR